MRRGAWQRLHLLHVGLTTYHLLLTDYLLFTPYSLLTTHYGGTFWTSGSPWCCLNDVSIAFSVTLKELRMAPMSWLGLGLGLGLRGQQ